MAESLPTRADLFRIGASEIFVRAANRGGAQRLKPEAVFIDGTDANLLVASSAAMGDEVLRHLSMRMAALQLDSASGEDLDRLVADRVSPTLVRKQPSRALASISFSRSDPTNPVTIPTGTRLKTPDGTEFSLLQPVSFQAGAVGPFVGLAQSQVAGRNGNVQDGLITEFVQSAPASDITLTNPAAASGGNDRQTDAEYRSIARAFYLTVRRGTLPAIEYGALLVPGVSRVSVTEQGIPGLPTGVTVYVADIDGRSNDTVIEAVRVSLLDYRAGGVPPTILAGEPEFVDISYRVQFEATTDSNIASERIKSRTVAALEVLKPGDTLLVSQLTAIARSVPGVIVPDDAIVTPAGDLVPTAPNRLIRTTRSRVTVTNGG